MVIPMTSTRKLRKQSKQIWEDMQREQAQKEGRDVPEKKTFCERHPKICVGAAVGLLGTSMVLDPLGTVSEAGLEYGYGKVKKKVDDHRKTRELRENSQKIWEDMQNKSAKKPKTSSPKKSTGTVKKKSPATAQKRATAKKSATPKKKSTVKKKTSRKPKDDGLDYWRII